jgi:hypothetical protein
VQAMRRHSSDQVLQARACGALRNLTRRVAANRTLAVNAGAIEVAIAAMRMHASVAELQERACGVLRNLSSSIVESRNLAGNANQKYLLPRLSSCVLVRTSVVTMHRGTLAPFISSHVSHSSPRAKRRSFTLCKGRIKV